ncbi:putative Iron dicitrate transmembrane sensor FecR [Nitrospira japonica]|uniref:Putative Iron dicitrate transmembrane sensor FecR n=1 Tax=Nitrospira japonica TaxID=1325564 RepID=A0A1W1IAL7_9BACT|nr:FecR family protein [Nitrospira japonica]SLM50097.1 putative Iron dicitrate transmembrane sensor FecR [Nitrospira japonica]
MDQPSTPLPSDQNQDRIADEAIAWFSRLRMSSATAQDLEAFERWCDAHPAHREVYERVSAMWDNPGLSVAASRTATFDGSRKTATAQWRPLAAIAASVVILILVILQWDLVTRAQADYYTGVGEQTTVRLPDQSVMTLNTSTAIAVQYDPAARKIHLLRGEASFKVTPDPSRPFVVEHQGIHTRAVGTEFIVRQLSRGALVTVSEGKVAVSNPTASWPVIPLEAGREARVDRGTGGEPYDVDLAIATAWLHGRLVVTSARLGDVLDEVRRYHSGTVMVWNRDIENMRITGTYNLNDPSKLLGTLSKTLSFRTITVAGRVTVLY